MAQTQMMMAQQPFLRVLHLRCRFLLPRPLRRPPLSIIPTSFFGSESQVGLIYDRYKPKYPADRWLPRTQSPLRSSGLGGNSSPLASTLVTLDAP